MNSNESVQLRVDMVDGAFDIDAETSAFMKTVRTEIARVAKRLSETAPATCDIGRFIAAIDHLQQSKNLFCDSAILGCEAAARKKRKLVQ